MLNKLNRVIDDAIESVPQLDQTGLSLSRAIHEVVLNGGEVTRSIVDVFHGKGMDHPLHAALTDLAIGGWLIGSIFDMMWLSKRSRLARDAADASLLIGTVAALPTALSGLADFTTIPQRAAGTALLHAVLNVTTTALFGTSLLLRRNRQRDAGVALAMASVATAITSAILGGHMAYSQRVGSNHDLPVEPLPEWTPAYVLASLPDGEAKRIDIQGHPVLLHRKGNDVFAISAVCSHDGGPLSEGQFQDCTVECPLHQSVFDLRDGSVVHGPATQAVTVYETRVFDGQIEVRLLKATR